MIAVDFATSQRAAQRAGGTAADRVGLGIGAQVALARRESPHRGGRLLGLAQALVSELPGVLAELRAGRTNEWRAIQVARETACLGPADRRAADAELAPLLGGLGDRGTEAAARRVAYRLDPAAFTARSAHAVKDRRVTLRPAPDTMSRLSGLLPVGQGVAAYAALTREADRLRAAGDPRSRSQIMADTFVTRLTGQATADAVPVEIHVVMTDTTLFGPQRPSTTSHATDATDATTAAGGPGEGRYDDVRTGEAWVDEAGVDEPAILLGSGPLPAPLARALVRETSAQVFLRRIFTRPGDGALVAMESRRRVFPDALRRLIVLRDQVCRTPWCDAAVRHIDHVIPHAQDGPTSARNGQGLCEACNHTKQAPGWHARLGPDTAPGAGEAVRLITPTGHTHTSRPPPPPGAPRPTASLIEQCFRRLLAAA